MKRIDVAATQADNIEFEFGSEADAERAERLFPTDYMHIDGKTLAYRSDGDIHLIRSRLEAAGIAWSESESSVLDEDWSGSDDDDADDTGASPGP